MCKWITAYVTDLDGNLRDDIEPVEYSIEEADGLDLCSCYLFDPAAVLWGPKYGFKPVSVYALRQHFFESLLVPLGENMGAGKIVIEVT
jgi:hypothetical protein